jgi:hypothetical protein
LWAVLGIEAAVAMPIMATTMPGTGNARLLGTFLVLLLLPVGYIAVRRVDALRDPAWRVLVGFLLVVLLRLQTPLAEGDGAAAAMARFVTAIVPAALAFALWWRGGSFIEAELTAADVQLEFLFGGVALLIMLVVFHGIVAIDPQILVWATGLFAVSGLIAVALARQDAADATSLGGGRVLASSVALLPIGVAIVLLQVLRPDVMGAMWVGLARLIELALTPLFLLLSWLASLLPARGAPTEARPVFRPSPRPPDLDALARQQAPPDWIPWLALTLVLLLVLFMAAGILRLLLESEVVVRTPGQRKTDMEGVTVESSGSAGHDVRQLATWLARWLRRRLARDGPLHATSNSQPDGPADARTAYRSLLAWAEQRGIGRHASETTPQLQDRLVHAAPDSREAVDLVTRTYEWERYGDVHPPNDRLQRVLAALRGLLDSPRR